MKFILSILYIISVFLIVQRIRYLHYIRNFNLQSIMVKIWDGRTPNYKDIYNSDELFKFFFNTFLKEVFTTRWYNEEPMVIYINGSSPYWTADHSWKMVGVPHIRQQRVSDSPCNSFVPPVKLCIPALSPDDEDKDLYNTGWTTYSPYDNWQSVTESPWMYEKPTTNWLKTYYRLQGGTGTIYDNGGYKAQLASSIPETINTVYELENDWWVDYFTKVVFIELTVYNVNLHCLGEITFITEYLTTGATVNELRISTVLVMCGIEIRHVVFIILTSLFILEICYNINYNGFKPVFTKVSNVLLVAIVVPSVFLITAFLVNVYFCKVTNLYDRYYNKKYEKFDFDTFVGFHTMAMFVLSILLLLSVLRTLLLFRSLRGIHKAEKIFKLSRNKVFFILLITSVFLIFLFQMLIHLDVLTSPNITGILVTQKDTRLIESEYFDHAHMIILFAKFGSWVIISIILLCIFIHITHVSKF